MSRSGEVINAKSIYKIDELARNLRDLIKKKVNAERGLSNIQRIKASVSELSFDIEKISPYQEITEIWKCNFKKKD